MVMLHFIKTKHYNNSVTDDMTHLSLIQYCRHIPTGATVSMQASVAPANHMSLLEDRVRKNKERAQETVSLGLEQTAHN